MFPGREGGIAVVIQKSLLTIRGHAPQVSGFETLFLKLMGFGDFLLFYQPPCCIATFLPELLEAISGLAVRHYYFFTLIASGPV